MDQEDRVSMQEAAQILGVTPSRLLALVDAGQINKYPAPSGRKRDYCLNLQEVLVLKKVREEKLNLPSVYSVAVEDSMRSRRLERLVKQLLIVNKLDAPILELGKEAIVSLRMRMESLLTVPTDYRDAYEWSRIFHAIGEETLEAIEQHTNDLEPWVLVTKVGKKLMKDAIGNPRPTLEARTAYNLLHSGVRNARAACVSYAMLKLGNKTALRLFPEIRQDAFSDLASLSASMFST
jgi:hypothetical protein